MNFNLGLTFSGMVYILLIIIIYFKRKRIKSKENKIYSLLLISTFVELLLGMVSYILIINIEISCFYCPHIKSEEIETAFFVFI